MSYVIDYNLRKIQQAKSEFYTYYENKIEINSNKKIATRLFFLHFKYLVITCAKNIF